jgi:hypothetical protein
MQQHHQQQHNTTTTTTTTNGDGQPSSSSGYAATCSGAALAFSVDALQDVVVVTGGLSNLKGLDLSFCRDIKECKPLRSMILPSRLRQLDLYSAPLMKNTYGGTVDGMEKSEIIKLLNKQIELGSVYCEDYKDFKESRLFSLEAEHLLDINECGGVILTDEASVVLSVYPTVLARANKRLQKFCTPCCTDRFASPVGALWKIANRRGTKLPLVQTPPNNPFPCQPIMMSSGTELEASVQIYTAGGLAPSLKNCYIRIRKPHF